MMEDTIITQILSIFVMLVFLFSLAFIGLMFIVPDTIIKEINTTTITYVEVQPKFLEIANKFASKHNYSFNKYDCRKYTIDLYHEYLRNNITAEPVIGYNLTTNQDYAHAVVKVILYVEPQTGKIIDFESDYENVENYDLVQQRYRDNLYNGLDVIK